VHCFFSFPVDASSDEGFMFFKSDPTFLLQNPIEIENDFNASKDSQSRKLNYL